MCRPGCRRRAGRHGNRRWGGSCGLRQNLGLKRDYTCQEVAQRCFPRQAERSSAIQQTGGLRYHRHAIVSAASRTPHPKRPKRLSAPKKQARTRKGMSQATTSSCSGGPRQSNLTGREAAPVDLDAVGETAEKRFLFSGGAERATLRGSQSGKSVVEMSGRCNRSRRL